MNAPHSLNSQNKHNWQAYLSLHFDHDEGRTRLRRDQRIGPVVVQKPFYPKQDHSVHIYLVHPPGGIAGGDELNLRLHLHPCSQVLLTTPGASKFYRSSEPSLVSNYFTIEDHACLEYLPQENIFYPQCMSQIRNEVHLAEKAQFISWDISSLGTIAHEAFQSANIFQHLRVFRQGRPLFVDGFSLAPETSILHAHWGLQNYSVLGNFLMCLSDPVELSPLRDITQQYNESGDLCSISQSNGVLITRYLGQKSARARKFFEQIWGVVRPIALARQLVRPRIWNT